jgi:uncharacterized LabA/DUF88 family protein
MPSEYRIHVFVDFWNYTLSAQSEMDRFSTDWKKFPKILTREAGVQVDPSALAIYSGMNVYGSYNSQTEKPLKNWAHSVLDSFPGVNAIFKPRTKVRGFPSCSICRAKVEKCPNCQNDMRGTEEKGVDTRIATDLINLAWEKAYDVAVLVSADQDFVPAAEHLQNRGIKVIHAGFPPKGSLLKRTCWSSIEIPRFMREFEYTRKK